MAKKIFRVPLTKADEAHHAVARTYRTIIDYVKERAKKNSTHVKMIGLTATPYRTNEAEKALLGKIFTDDIIYKIDLDTLIKRGILSTPICKTYETHVLAGEIVNTNMAAFGYVSCFIFGRRL